MRAPPGGHVPRAGAALATALVINTSSVLTASIALRVSARKSPAFTEGRSPNPGRVSPRISRTSPKRRWRRTAWFDDTMADRLGAMRGTNETYSDAILGLVGMEGACAPQLGWQSRSFSRSSIPSLGDGAMLGTAWIDRPVDTQGCAPCFHVFLRGIAKTREECR